MHPRRSPEARFRLVRHRDLIFVLVVQRAQFPVGGCVDHVGKLFDWYGDRLERNLLVHPPVQRPRIQRSDAVAVGQTARSAVVEAFNQADPQLVLQGCVQRVLGDSQSGHDPAEVFGGQSAAGDLDDEVRHHLIGVCNPEAIGFVHQGDRLQDGVSIGGTEEFAVPDTERECVSDRRPRQCEEAIGNGPFLAQQIHVLRVDFLAVDTSNRIETCHSCRLEVLDHDVEAESDHRQHGQDRQQLLLMLT